MKPLTSRQEEILRFIAAFNERLGRTPTGPEISEHFGFGHVSTAYQHLELMEKKGILDIQRFGKRRPIAVRLTARALQLLAVAWPVLGAIPAGELTEVLDEDTETIRNIEDLVPVLKPGDFFLRVTGDSMIDAGIYPGHLVILRPNVHPAEADIAAAWVDGEGATLKFVHYENGAIRLQPANKQYKAKVYPVEQVRFQGVLVGKIDVQIFKR
jgi:repressor LexA